MGLQMLGLIVFFTLAGYYLDHWMDWKFPLFTVLFSLAGVIGSMYSIIRKL